jgi:leucyl aminopeptidase
VREVTATVVRYLAGHSTETAAMVLLGNRSVGLDTAGTAQAVTEGIILGTYVFRRHKTEPPDNKEIKELTLVAPGQRSTAAAFKGYEKGKILAEAVVLCRNLVNEPSNFKNPTTMEQKARELAASYGLKANVLNREEMLGLGMGGLLGVTRGSVEPPKFIILDYRGRSGSADIDLVLAGKAITFDSGGISIKPSENMGEMKMDMAGGAAAMAAISAIAQLKPELNVTALIPATENMPGGSAFHPGDVLTALNGKTMEIITTDAEGRLILADALSYAVKLQAKNIIDIATLTGACIVALGDDTTGVFSNNDALVSRLLAAASVSGEPAWRLPLGPKYRELIRSDVADIKNSGGRPAGAITAAEFLKEFVGDTPWVHMDIAGTAWADKEQGYLTKGATGNPVRTLVNLALALAEK